MIAKLPPLITIYIYILYCKQRLPISRIKYRNIITWRNITFFVLSIFYSDLIMHENLSCEMDFFNTVICIDGVYFRHNHEFNFIQLNTHCNLKVLNFLFSEIKLLLHTFKNLAMQFLYENYYGNVIY